MIRVILVRPRGPRNVGSVLRAALNFGPAELTLVAPLKRSVLLHPDFVQMAHGVEDAAGRIRIVATLGEALAECTASAGFTVRERDHTRLEDCRDVRDRLAELAHDPSQRLALVFGSEEGGLSTEEIAPLQELVRIPTSDEHASINVAMAAGIVLSTIFLARAESARASSHAPLAGADRAFLTARAREVFGRCARSPEAARDIRAMVERVFPRATMETRDARAWHLLLRALGDESTPRDYDLPG